MNDAKVGRISAPAWVVRLVDEWVAWHESEVGGSDPLGYPALTAEARLLRSPGRTEGVVGSRVPLRGLPPRLALVERAIASMPEDMRVALLYRHTDGLGAYQEASRRTKAAFYSLSGDAYWFLAGRVSEMQESRG